MAWVLLALSVWLSGESETNLIGSYVQLLKGPQADYVRRHGFCVCVRVQLVGGYGH